MVPFATATEAWFWTMDCLADRRDPRVRIAGGGNLARRGPLVRRPCDPDDIVKALDRLYRMRRIDLAHARVMARWAQRREEPPRAAGQEFALWREAMDRLGLALQLRGIVAAPVL